MLERNHLEILNAINEKGTLAAAADSLFVTQSALSQSIKKLEDISQVQLWKKSGRSIRLTEAGQYLLEVSQRILPQFDHAESVLKKFRHGSRGILRLGMECHPCYKWLMHILSPYLTAWPDVDVDVRKQFSFKGLDALQNFEVDMLLTPDAINIAGVKFYPVFDYEQVLVVSSSHPFAHLNWIEAKMMSTQSLITYPIENDRLDIFRDFMTPANIKPQRHSYVEDTDILLQMVSAGRGVSALPRWLVEEYREEFNLVPISLGEMGVRHQIFIGIRDEATQPLYLRAFLELAGADLTS